MSKKTPRLAKTMVQTIWSPCIIVLAIRVSACHMDSPNTRNQPSGDPNLLRKLSYNLNFKHIILIFFTDANPFTPGTHTQSLSILRLPLKSRMPKKSQLSILDTEFLNPGYKTLLPSLFWAGFPKCFKQYRIACNLLALISVQLN